MHVPAEQGFIERESRVRQVALRAATAFSVFLASLLFFLIVPVFPKELMVLCAFVLGALAYKAPTLAIMLSLVLALPGYLYQLKLSLPVEVHLSIVLVVIMPALVLGIAFVASELCGALGIAAGAIAAVLMLTPLHFLALPVIIGTILIRSKGTVVRTASTVLTFFLLYFPMLAINNGTSPEWVAPIFEPVIFHAKPTISVLGMSEISTALEQAVDTSSTGGTRIYLANLGNYWPLSFEKRLLPVGLLFCVLAGVGIAAASGMLALFRWLKKRGVNHDYLPYFTPSLSLLSGVMAFFLLASILARPFDSANTINITSLLVGTIFVGCSSSLAEVWLRKRDRILNMRDHLIEQANTVHAQTDFLMERIKEIKAQCHRMETSAEEALCKVCQQELTFVEQTVTHMSLNDLKDKVTRFEELLSKLGEYVQESGAKLYQYYDEDRQKYNDCLALAKKYGFDLGENVQGPAFSQLTTMEYDEVLNLQILLNQSYESSARLLADGVKKLQDRLCSEVAADFIRTGIRIASDYFARQRCAEALQEFLLELGDIERILQETISGLDKDVLTIKNSLKTTMTDVLIPTAVNLGDVSSVSYYNEVLDAVNTLNDQPFESPTLPDLLRTLTTVGKLGGIMTSLSSKLTRKIHDLEKSIKDKTPRGHSWDVDPKLHESVTELSSFCKRYMSTTNIHDRMALLKKGPSAVGSVASVIKDYSIAYELLINYANIESLVEERLNKTGFMSVDELPVSRQYSRDFLELYRTKHPKDVLIEADTGRLARIDKIQSAIKVTRKK